ncbi:MAG: inositol monophosphatase family protein [Myxococcota bacterium]
MTLRALAESLAREAGAVLRRKFAETRTVEFKGNRTDLVTDADRASEEVILSRLRAEVPTHAVLAEESGAVGQGDFLWLVDPLDGTVNYAHGVPHFCVSIAVEGPVSATERALLASAIYDPIRDELFSAARGEGAWLEGRRLRCTNVPDLGHALLCTGFPYDLEAHPEAPLGLFLRLVKQSQGMRRMGSAALDLAYVAAGRFDAFFEFGLKPWDTAAGALLVMEAGGHMRSIDASPFSPLVGDVLAFGPGLERDFSENCAAYAKEIGWAPRPFR